MNIIESVEQGSDEWLLLRSGKITASRFKDVLSGGAGKTRKSYMYEIAAEIITGQPAESYSNKYMEWGTETEPQARAMYEFDTGLDVREVAFIEHDSLAVGASPDGLIGDDGGIEIKCPKTTTQIETYLSGKMPAIHKGQVQGSLWISQREWWDFVSFDPRVNGKGGYFCQRQYRDEEYIKSIEQGCSLFISELNEIVETMRSGNA